MIRALLALVLLGACTLPAPVDVAAQRRERCLAQGYEPDTDGMRTCVLLLELYSEEQWRDRLAEIERRRLEREERW